METPDFTFESDPANRFPTLDADGFEPQVVIDRAMGVLRITPHGAEPLTFPLVMDDDPHPQAVFLRHYPDLPTMIEVGTVDFKDQPEYLEDYPLNHPDVRDEWKLNLADGGIGILDIRNVGRLASTVFEIGVVPIVISITGIYLRVATLKHIPTSGLQPWYRKVPVSQP